MKTIVSKSDLRDAVSHILPAVAVKPGTPILAGIYLRAEQSGLTLRATNFELDITAKIPANVEVEGECIATGKHLSAIVNKLGGDVVTLIDENSQLTIRSEAASFDILTFDPGDFPKAPLINDATSFRIHRNDLRELIRRTVFACSKDQSRPVFTGVNFVLNGTTVTAVGTNTARIAIVTGKIFDEASANVVIPTATLNAIQFALDVNSVIDVEFDKSHAVFAFDNLRIITRFIDGTFPPANKVIPESCATTAEVDIAELRAAIDRIQIISSEHNDKKVDMAFTQDGLEISAISYNVGKAVEHVDADVKGDDLMIAFNYNYLLDVLKILDGKTCTFGMNQSLSPALIKGADEDFVYVITPLRTH